VALLLLASSGVSRTSWQEWRALPARLLRPVLALDWQSVTPDVLRGRSLEDLPWVWILNGVACAAGLVIVVRLARPLRRPHPRRTVRRLAQSGGTLAGIARRSRLSQDAVRTLLAESDRKRVSAAAGPPASVAPAPAAPVPAAPAPAAPASAARTAPRKLLPFGTSLRKEGTEERPELVEGLSLVR
jgi:hypothetical protein